MWYRCTMMFRLLLPVPHSRAELVPIISLLSRQSNRELFRCKGGQFCGAIFRKGLTCFLNFVMVIIIHGACNCCSFHQVEMINKVMTPLTI